MSASSPDFDSVFFRTALGRYATGVTVVTTAGLDGAPIGLTVSSFNSVSLNPPLVLWSLSLGSSSLEAFEQCERYVVNVLSADQIALPGVLQPARRRTAMPGCRCTTHRAARPCWTATAPPGSNAAAAADTSREITSSWSEKSNVADIVASRRWCFTPAAST